MDGNTPLARVSAAPQGPQHLELLYERDKYTKGSLVGGSQQDEAVLIQHISSAPGCYCRSMLSSVPP